MKALLVGVCFGLISVSSTWAQKRECTPAFVKQKILETLEETGKMGDLSKAKFSVSDDITDEDAAEGKEYYRGVFTYDWWMRGKRTSMAGYVVYDKSNCSPVDGANSRLSELK